MILRLLALAVLLFLAYRLIRRALASLRPPRADAPPSTESQPVVPCKTCGTFIPRDQARTDGEGHYFCSAPCLEHTRQRD